MITSRQEEEREAKAYALKCFASLVEEGLAQWRHAADGAAELRLVTGEVYRLGENTLWRIVWRVLPILLSEPDHDFTGGDFVLTEQRLAIGANSKIRNG
jgi:hypothetical protein